MSSERSNRTIYEIVGVVLAVVFMAVFFIFGRSGANTIIDNAQATAAALQNTVNELRDAPNVPDLSDELATAEVGLAAAQTEVAQLLAATAVISATAPPTATATTVPPTPTLEPCFPDNLDEVVAIRDPRVNLFEETGRNAVGKPIMSIYEDDNGNRTQYPVGATFYVFEAPVLADGGSLFYEVFGPLGQGLFAKDIHIKLFDADPPLLLCSSQQGKN